MLERFTINQMQTPLLNRDEELRIIASAQNGDLDAVGTLYDLHVNNVYRFALYRLGDPHRAEDVTSEVFLKMIKSLPSYHDKKVPFKAWIIRIARNEVVDHFRRTKVHDSRNFRLPEDVYFNSANGDGDPQEVLEGKKEIESLKEAISHLSQIQQEVIAYRFLLGFSHEDTAKVLGKRTVAIKAIQHRGLQKLRKLMLANEQTP